MSSRLEFLILTWTLCACEKLLSVMNVFTTSGIPPIAMYSLKRERNLSFLRMGVNGDCKIQGVPVKEICNFQVVELEENCNFQGVGKGLSRNF